MKKSKLIDILSTFTKDDIKQFRDFIKSPFFTKKKEVLPFYELLLKYHPDFPETKIARTEIFAKLYPNDSYNEKQLGYLMSYLSKLAEQYIGFQKYQSDELMPTYHLLSAFIERNLHKYYLQENKKAQAVLSENEKKSSGYFLKKYLIASVALSYFNIQLQQKRRHDQSLQFASDSLDLFYITAKLEHSCEMANQINILDANYQIHFSKFLENEVQTSDLSHEPLVAIYLQIFKMLQTEVTTEQIDSLRTLVRKETSKFSVDETQKFYRYAINFCLQMLRKGKYEFMEQAHELYLDGIEQGIFYENNYLSPWVYTNVIRLGIALNKHTFTEKFIYEYNPRLPKENRENALHFNLAELFYSIKDFDKATDHLNLVKFSDFQMHVGSREILAKVYYETGEEEALLSLIASYSIFLKRNKIMSATVKRPHLNFCDLLNQIMRKNPKKLLVIRNKITLTSPLSNKTWLLKTCDEIMKEVGLKP